MGVYKLGECTCKNKDRCAHAWWGSFKENGTYARVPLAKAFGRDVDNGTAADKAFDDLKAIVRAHPNKGTLGTAEIVALRTGASTTAATVYTVRTLAERFIEKHYAAKKMASAGKAPYFIPAMEAVFADRDVTTLRIADMEDFFADLAVPCLWERASSQRWSEKRQAFYSVKSWTLKDKRSRTVATVNRYLAFMGKMFTWAIERDLIDMRHPFFNAKGVRVVKKQYDDAERTRVFSRDEESKLLLRACPLMRSRIICAVESGLRHGEMVSMTIADLDADPGWIRVRGENAKSGKTRYVPIETARLRKVIEAARLDQDGQPKPADALVFDEWNDRYAWLELMEACDVKGARWHDWRATYATRLIDKGVPLSKVRDLLGHHSTTVTERYDRLSKESLRQAAAVLDDGIKFVSSETEDAKKASTTAAA